MRPHRKANARRTRGITLLETLLAIVVGLIFLAGVVGYMLDAETGIAQAAAARQLEFLGSAVTTYVQNNDRTLAAQASATRPVVVPLSTLS